ncbi:hypothetical protein AGIG_G18359 [Arapaima gigas]
MHQSNASSAKSFEAQRPQGRAVTTTGHPGSIAALKDGHQSRSALQIDVRKLLLGLGVAVWFLEPPQRSLLAPMMEMKGPHLPGEHWANSRREGGLRGPRGKVVVREERAACFRELGVGRHRPRNGSRVSGNRWTRELERRLPGEELRVLAAQTGRAWTSIQPERDGQPE